MQEEDVKELDKAASEDMDASEPEKSEQELWDELTSEESQEDTSFDDDDQYAEEDAEGELGEEGDTPDAKRQSENDDDQQNADATDKSAEDYEAEIEKLRHQLASERGRTAKSRKEIEALNAQIAEARERAEAISADDTALMERDAKLDEAAREYGDVIGPLLEEVREQRKRQNELTAAEQRRLAQDEQRLNTLLDEQDEVLREYHPDGLDIVRENAEVFREWIQDQPKQLRDIFVENQSAIVDGRGVALLLSEFKLGLQNAQPKSEANMSPAKAGGNSRRNRQLAGARSTSGRSPRIVTSEPATGGSEADHWEYFEKLDKRRAAR